MIRKNNEILKNITSNCSCIVVIATAIFEEGMCKEGMCKEGICDLTPRKC